MSEKIKIMVVEDEMIIAAKVGMFLSDLGYEVSALLPGAEEALAHLDQHRPDFALVDIQLSGPMDGIGLAQLLREKHQLPVIFLTANADDKTFERAKAAQPFAFLQKPFRKTELQRTLELAFARIAGESEEAITTASSKEGHCLEDRIFVRYQDKMVKIMFTDILHVTAERSYCRIVATDKEYLLTMPMKRIKEKLPTSTFQRIHRSHIVNIQRVDEVSDGMVRVAGERLPLSPALKVEFMNRLNAV